MCKRQDIARKCVHDHIKNRKDFNYGELQKEIVSEGGILSIESGYTLGQYIQDLDERNIITFNAKENIYEIIGF